MTTVEENFARLMQCKDTQQLAEILAKPLPIPMRIISMMSDESLEQTYKSSLAQKDYFGAFSAAELVLINALRREDYVSIYAHVAAMLFTSILDDSETAFVCLSLVWPIVAFCQKGPKPENLATFAITGSWIMNASNQKRQEGGVPADGETAMLLFQSMSIFHILEIRKVGLPQPDGDPMEYAKQMERFQLKGVVEWVSENS
jgi:hypothetical protein